MTLRAKFLCNSVADHRSHVAFKDGGYTVVSLSACYSSSPEDNQFSKATPTGSFTMTVTTDAGKSFFEVGKSYYLDISEVES